MPRQDTRLEAEVAEFLVLGQLLLHRIPSYKTYTNMPGYDLVATNPDTGRSARIQVKSRWRTNAPGFLIKNLDCEFVVAATLNRGSKTRKAEVRPPQYFVLPKPLVESVLDTTTWSKVKFRDIDGIEAYENAWELVAKYLESGCHATE